MDGSAITPELVSRLLSAQFPHWGHLPVRPVELDGSDNTTYRLGEAMSVRVPRRGRQSRPYDVGWTRIARRTHGTTRS